MISLGPKNNPSNPCSKLKINDRLYGNYMFNEEKTLIAINEPLIDHQLTRIVIAFDGKIGLMNFSFGRSEYAVMSVTL